MTSAKVAAGYSDLVAVDDNYAAIVFESGTSIRYSELNVAAILK